MVIVDPDGQVGNFDELTATVTVADGRLTLQPAAGSSNSKICFIDIILAIAPEAARSPSPAKEATDVPREVVISWAPGEGVTGHDVYFGTNFDTSTPPAGPIRWEFWSARNRRLRRSIPPACSIRDHLLLADRRSQPRDNNKGDV